MCTLTFCCYDGFSEQVGLCVPSHSVVMMDLVNK